MKLTHLLKACIVVISHFFSACGGGSVNEGENAEQYDSVQYEQNIEKPPFDIEGPEDTDEKKDADSVRTKEEEL